MLDSLEALTKIPLYASLLVLVGFWIALWLVRASRLSARDTVPITHSAIAARAAVILLVFLIARLFAHTYATFGDDAWSIESLQTIALRSRWGSPWRLQMMIGLGLLWASARAQRGITAVTFSGTMFAVVLAAAFTMMGHSASQTTHSLVAATHIVAAGAWIGTLAVLALTSYRGPLWTRFSSVAMVGSGLVAVSGLLMTTFYLSTPSELVSTSYGRLLLAKLALVGGIALCGFVNWRQVKASGAPTTARLELALAAALVVVTAFLTETAHP